MRRFITILGMVALAAAGCSSAATQAPATAAPATAAPATAAPTAAPTATPEPYTIGVIFNTLNHPYTTAAGNAVQAECTAKGVTCTILDPKFDATVQDQMASQLITQKVDAIVVIPVSAETFGATAKRIVDAGIKLIDWNTPVATADEKYVAAFSGPSNIKEGASAADFMHKALNGTGKIIIIEGQAGNAASSQRTQGFEEELAKLNSGIEIVAKQPADWDRAKALSITQALLTRTPDVVGIYTHDDDLAQGSIQAALAQGLKVGEGGLIVIGIGGSREGVEAVRKGEMAGTVMQSPSLDGKSVIDLAIRVLNGETVEYWNYIDTPAVGKEEAQTIQGEW